MMKTWNIPEIRELNINATANGILNSCYEWEPLGFPLSNDSKKETPPDDPVNDPS